MTREETLKLLRKRLDEQLQIDFKNGVVVETWKSGGAIGVVLPGGIRRTFGPSQIGDAYDLAIGKTRP